MDNQVESFYQQAQVLLLRDPPDYENAVPLLKRAVQAGHAEAAFQLAACMFAGNGIEADFAHGVKLLELAALKGHLYARYNLLQIQAQQGAQTKDQFARYLDLARQGLAEAQLWVMRAYSDGGAENEALAWAEKAAAQGHPQAFYFLAHHYQYAAQPALQKARELYHQAAERGLTAAHWQLGLQYRYGQGVAQDAQRAAFHLKAAAENGLPQAQTALAEILLPNDAEQALHWFQTASDAGSSDADAALAEIYLLGKHVPRDAEKARLLAERAAESGHSDGLRLLGDIYRYGLGVETDAEKARQYYRKAADAGNIAAYQKLLSDSALNNQSDYSETKAAALKLQQAEALYQQANAAHYGLMQQQNYAEALSFYRKAAQLGHRKAQTNLGMMYYSAQGVAQDYAQAAQWFEAAALQGDTMAQYNLACLHFHGMGVPRNAETACTWLQRAINGGHSERDTLGALLAEWKKAV
ncbi:hypothetical protein BG910_00715 [Neisseria chenwenguii]|uniref:Uncharacterized protein n=2 Tax=Neisseria chenwenguii TaxID=1853278 RepID=A0A220RZ26_9NEIS|nr:tetratricopeptide repeat protein [Neisseria chenwenguii]ASK26460.1 hypothetical protein BG910_00715 [Neisseria chenwenguii]ROV55902.1 sel1 repeat family protein [Neisseria chenwenguii]